MASSCISQVSGPAVSSKILILPANNSSNRSHRARVCLSNGLLAPSLNSSSVTRSSVTLKRRAVVVAADTLTSTSEPEVEPQIVTVEDANVDDVPVVVEVEQSEASPSKGKLKKTKGLKNIMQVLHQRAVEAATDGKDIPDLRIGDIVQLRVEVPENKKRVSLLRGIVIAKHNAGIHTTFRIRRVIAGVGVEMVFPLYSPNIKEIKVVNSRKVRRAKLYYLRDKIARLSSC